MYVVHPTSKLEPYEFPFLPPYRGPRFPDALPDRFGHFDYLEPGTPAFNAAHLYGAVRRVLDIWEAYFEREIPWRFRAPRSRLELIAFVDWNNAQCGYGYLEVGYGESETGGARLPYCLNFDVLAHETGHGIIYSELGVPATHAVTTEYRGFQEASADLVALISAMHFDSVVDRVLLKSAGNIYAENELNRIGELSETEQIRHASNEYKMSDVPDVRIPPELLSQPELHLAGEPLTGAGFDILVEIYQELLVELGLIDGRTADLSYHVPQNQDSAGLIQERFDRAYRGRHAGFALALRQARDCVGRILALAWSGLSPDFLSYRGVAAALLDAERIVSGGRFRRLIEENLAWREIPLPEPAGRATSREDLAGPAAARAIAARIRRRGVSALRRGFLLV
ncbi:MAG: hypothetical protein ACREDZ_09665 [Kiloniellales bacterium]